MHVTWYLISSLNKEINYKKKKKKKKSAQTISLTIVLFLIKFVYFSVTFYNYVIYIYINTLIHKYKMYLKRLNV